MNGYRRKGVEDVCDALLAKGRMWRLETRGQHQIRCHPSCLPGIKPELGKEEQVSSAPLNSRQAVLEVHRYPRGAKTGVTRATQFFLVFALEGSSTKNIPSQVKMGDSSTSNGIPVWLDVDTGHDDVFAILIAAHHPQLEFLGVSSTHGNAPQIHTTNNSSAVLNAVGRTDVSVYPGAIKPFCRDEVDTPDIHGPTGLGGTTLLPQPTTNIVRDVNFIAATRDAIMSQPFQTAWYVATGPCTNAALLFSTYPEVAHHLAGLSIMGGAVGGDFCPQISKEFGKTLGQGEGFGNETPWAEFNIYCDPEAAQAVFSNPVIAAKTTLITLDLTHQCLATKEVRERFLGSEKPSQLRLFLHEILTFFAESYVEWFDVHEGPPLHDPLAVAALFGYTTGIFEEDGDRYDVKVVTDGAHSPLDSVRKQVGRTVVQKIEGGLKGSAGGVRIPRKLHTHAFWDVLALCAKTADEKATGML